jgi:hypothetical protein
VREIFAAQRDPIKNNASSLFSLNQCPTKNLYAQNSMDIKTQNVMPIPPFKWA